MHTLDTSMTSTISTAQSSKYLPWLVCFTAALFFFYEFIQMNMFNAISPDLMRDFGINATQLGQLSAYYFYANLIFLPIAGTLLDRFSTRLIILTALTICTIGIALFATSHSLAWSSVYRFMSGIGSAFCFLSSIRLASRWFPAQRMALVAGLIVTMAMTGGMVAQTPLTLLSEYLGWRHALLLDACLGLMIGAFIFAIVRDYPADTQSHQQAAHSQLKAIGLLKSWRLSYLNYQNWFAGFYTCLLNLPVALLGAIWGSLYLEQAQHLTRTQASFVPMMLFIGTIIGCPVMGWFSDFLRKRKLPMFAGAILSLAVVLTIIYVSQLSLTAYIVLFLLLGFITSTQVISYPLITESNPKILTATSVSVVSFCAIGGYALFQPIFGWLMDMYWDGKIINNLHIYSLADFHRAMLILPVGFIVAILFCSFLKETYCQSKE
jgi:MFS family permease